MSLLGRVIEVLRRRAPDGDGGTRIIRKSSDRGKPQLDVDPIEELAKLIGQTEPGDPLSHGKPTSARRIRSRPNR